MILTLLGVTFLTSLAVSAVVVLLFTKPIREILRRIISDEISEAWVKYLKFAMYVVGVSSGVRLSELEKYINPPGLLAQTVQLSRERWVLEVYRAMIESLQGLAWLLLVFFVFALIAYVIVRAFELRRAKAPVQG